MSPAIALYTHLLQQAANRLSILPKDTSNLKSLEIEVPTFRLLYKSFILTDPPFRPNFPFVLLLNKTRQSSGWKNELLQKSNLKLKKTKQKKNITERLTKTRITNKSKEKKSKVKPNIITVHIC